MNNPPCASGAEDTEVMSWLLFLGMWRFNDRRTDLHWELILIINFD